jgi:hypothetical protein
MMDEIERAIPTPHIEIIQGRARRQVFRDGPPLTTGGQNNMRPFTISRMITVRLSPPRLPGGISGSTSFHSSSVRSLG